MQTDLFAVVDKGGAQASPFVVVYKITNTVTGAGYVGVTQKGIAARFASHRKVHRREDTVLYRAMRKYGPEAFKIEILHEASHKAELYNLERHMVALHRTFVEDGGYNMTRGGEGSPEICEMVRANMRRAASERMKNPETRAKIAKTLIGNPTSIKNAYELSQRNIGRKLSDQHKAALSKSKRGRVASAETRERIGAARRGKKLPQEWIEKVQKAITGKKRSEESKQRMREAAAKPEAKARRSAAAKLMWERRRNG